MAEFKFNFFTEDTKDATGGSKLELSHKPVLKLDLDFLKQEQTTVPVYTSPTIKNISGNEFAIAFEPKKAEMIEIQHLYPNSKSDEKQLIDWSSGPSDIVAGVYEGGFRLWEGAVDLVEYLTNQNVAFEGKSVLEIGCGIGIPGILALRKGAKVWFQDYNTEVLECATVPHTFMNISNHEDVFKNATFLSGAWSNLILFLVQNALKFDFILMAETIYDTSNYQTLLDIIQNGLVPNGTVFVAAKQTYFGLSGNTKEFKEYVAKNEAFQCETIVTIETYVPREIFKINRNF